jgi:hypothetical protein
MGRERSKAWEKIHANFWQGEQKGNLAVNGRIILKTSCKEQDWRVWTGLIWLRIGKSDLAL